MEDHSGYTMEPVSEEEIKKENESELKLTLTAGTTKKDLQCHVCDKILGHRSSLYKHLKYIHKMSPAQRLPIACHEEGCTQLFTFIDPFRKHLVEYHGFEIEVVKYVFQSMSDFFVWKKHTEGEEKIRFIASTGPRSSKSGTTHYFRCHRNGIYKPELKKRQLMSNSMVSATPIHCIASMFVFEEPDSVTVEYCKTHYGHDFLPTISKPPVQRPKVRNISSKLAVDSNSSDDDASVQNEADSTCMDSAESLSNCQLINNEEQINFYLTENDKAILVNVLKENTELIQNTKELFYENESRIMLKIAPEVVKKLFNDFNDVMYNMNDDTESSCASDLARFSCKDDVECKVEIPSDSDDGDNDSDAEYNSRIFQSLGNGMFVDTSSNKRIKIENINKTIEYLHDEEDDDDLILKGLEQDEKLVYTKRKRILSQLQTILMLVNEENNLEVLDEVEEHLSKYASGVDV